MADSSTVAMPSTTSPSPGTTSPGPTTTRSPTVRSDAATVSNEPSAPSPPGRRRRSGSPAGSPPGRLPAALGHGLGHVGEEDGGPQPERDAPGEPRGVGDRHDGRQERADPHDEDDGAVPDVPGVELAHGLGQGRDELAGEGAQREGSGHDSASARGPRASAGKNVRPVTTTATPTKRPAKVGVWVGSVPAVDRSAPLCHQRSRECEDEHDGHEPPEEHAEREREVGVGRVGGEAREGAAVVVGGGRVRVHHLRQTVRSGGEHLRA